MQGKTHMRIAALSYILVQAVPGITQALPFYNGTNKISIAGIAMAGIAGLLPDADHHNSKINHLNPIISTVNEGVDLVEGFLKTVIHLIFTLGIGVLIYLNREVVKEIFLAFKYTKKYALLWTYGSASMLIFLGVAGKNGRTFMKAIPMLGAIYSTLESILHGLGNFLKRIFVTVTYLGMGIWMLWYNYMYIKDTHINLIGVLFIGIAIFPHRTFLHSIEGLLIITFSARYMGIKLGFVEMTQAFFVGYISHLYLTDALTNEGIPLSSIPTILEKLGLQKKLLRFKVYRQLDRILQIKIRLPLMKTGTNWGNIFENIYELFFIMATLTVIWRYGGRYTII